jgi:hypothetical protein
MTEKATKEESHYRKGNGKEHCGICTMFVSPDSCTSVEGDISEDDLCDYFKKISFKEMLKKVWGPYGN